MEIKVENNDNYALVSLDGKLDSVSSGETENKLKEIMSGEQKTILINMENMKYISSAGLRVLLIMAKKAKAAQSRLILSSLIPEVKDVFNISGLANLFEIHDSVEEAVKTL